MKWRAAGALLAMVAGSVLALPPADAVAVQTCGVSHTWTLCLTVPDGALTGDVPISVTVSGKDRDKLEKLIFTYRPSGSSSVELIRDFERPYGFLWPTDKELDGAGVIAVQVESTSNDIGEKVRAAVTLANGNLEGIRRNPADWAARFHPEIPATGDPVIAAVGRGAMGKRVNDDVVDSILARAPSLFLYLGEVYEFGTYASMRNWYGLADLDDPAGEGTAWGRMASYTAPTAGNHDTLEGTGPWLDYWHQRPLYTSFDFGGVHYLDLDSNCGQVGGCGTTSKQYAFFKADLQANSLPCVVAYWNKTILSLDDFREGSSMTDLWSLIAKNGGDLVLNAGGHGMEEWKPLNPTLQAGRWNSHMVELNVSSGTDRWERVYRPDDRNAWQAYPQLGALSMTADGGALGPATALTWTFHDTAGTTLRWNSVSC